MLRIFTQYSAVLPQRDVMGCLEDLTYEIVLSKISISEAAKFLGKYKEYYDLESGSRVAGARLIGNPNVRVAIDGNSLLFPYTKPCHGTFLVKVELSEEEIEVIRKDISSKRK